MSIRRSAVDDAGPDAVVEVVVASAVVVLAAEVLPVVVVVDGATSDPPDRPDVDTAAPPHASPRAAWAAAAR